MNKILEQIIQKIETKKAATDSIQTNTNTDYKSVEIISTDEFIYLDNQLDQRSSNFVCDTHNEMKATNSRFHCLPLDLDKTKEDNGVAVLSPSVDITNDLISPLRSSHEAIKTTDDNNIENNEDLISTDKKDIYDVDVLSLRLAIETQNERLERLERAIERLDNSIVILAENLGRSNAGSKISAKRILQLDEQLPDKITIQYFSNTGRTVPPRVKLELQHKQLDKNGKPYYTVYQKLYGDCYKDFGRTKLDKFMGYAINYDYRSHIEPLQDFVHRMTRDLEKETECLGAFLYEKDTIEIFYHAYIIINIAQCHGNIFLYDGNDFAEEAFAFAPSKAKDGPKSPDGIYIMNKNKISELLGLTTTC